MPSSCSDYGKLLASKGERAVTVRRCDTVEEVLRQADVRRAWGHRAGWWCGGCCCCLLVQAAVGNCEALYLYLNGGTAGGSVPHCDMQSQSTSMHCIDCCAGGVPALQPGRPDAAPHQRGAVRAAQLCGCSWPAEGQRYACARAVATAGTAIDFGAD